MPADIPDPIAVRNTHICVLACGEWTQATSLCNHGGMIQKNAKANACPHPGGNKFAAVADGEFIVPTISATAYVAEEQWKITGPLLWAELHRWALTARLAPPDTAWLTNWLARIMCGDCKRDALKWVADHPPDWGSNEGLFRWSVEFHNYVNAKLRKPIMSVGDAEKRWG